MSEEEYTKYLKILRNKDEKAWISTMSLKQRMRWHPFLRVLMKASRVIMGIKVCKLNTDTSIISEDRPLYLC